MFLPHMFTPEAAWTGPLGNSLSTRTSPLSPSLPCWLQLTLSYKARKRTTDAPHSIHQCESPAHLGGSEHETSEEGQDGRDDRLLYTGGWRRTRHRSACSCWSQPWKSDKRLAAVFGSTRCVILLFACPSDWLRLSVMSSSHSRAFCSTAVQTTLVTGSTLGITPKSPRAYLQLIPIRFFHTCCLLEMFLMF